MRFSGLVVLIAAALAGCDALAPPAAPKVEYRPELAGTVDHALCLLGFRAAPLQHLATGHHLVAGSLNGVPARFLLDTGANISIVHAPYADQFKLTPQIGAVGVAIGLGGGQRATRSAIEALEIGGVDTRQKTILMADLSQLSILDRVSGEPIHGIIGQDVMRQQRTVIDVERPMLYLQAEGRAPEPVAAERCAARAGPPAAEASG